MKTNNKRRAVRRGAAAVEFAIVLPLLATLVLGCVDFGRFVYTRIAVTNAARTAADFASRHGYSGSTRDRWEEKTREAAMDDMGSVFKAQKDKGWIEVAVRELDRNARVRVEVACRFQTVVSWPFLPKAERLARTVEMRVIR